MEQVGSLWTIFRKFNICIYFLKYVEKSRFYWNLTRITGTSHEDQYTFTMISRSVVLRMRKFSGKLCRGIKKNTFYVQ